MRSFAVASLGCACALLGSFVACGGAPIEQGKVPVASSSGSSSELVPPATFTAEPGEPRVDVVVDVKVDDPNAPPQASAAMLGVKDALRTCWKDAHAADPLVGKTASVTLELAYDAQGDVTESKAAQTDAGDVLTRCLRDTAFTVVFGQAKKAGSVRVALRVHASIVSSHVSMRVTDATGQAMQRLQEELPSIATCYADALHKTPRFGGEMALSIAFAGDGSASEPKVETASVPSDVGACIVDALRHASTTDAPCRAHVVLKLLQETSE